MPRIVQIETKITVLHDDGTPVVKVLQSTPINCADEMVAGWERTFAGDYSDQLRKPLAEQLRAAFAKPVAPAIVLDPLEGLNLPNITPFDRTKHQGN